MARTPVDRSNEFFKRGMGKADDETHAIIFQGANVSQLGLLFKADHKTVQRRIQEGNVKPCRTEGPTKYYAVHEIAPWIVKPVIDDLEGQIRRMSFRDLPKDLAKEFWAGQRAKQEYEEKAGLLWRTEKVVEEVGELMKLVKMTSLLMLDAVERQTELSERQRSIIKTLTHGMLQDLQKRIEEKFKAPEESNGKLQEAEGEEEL